MRKPKPHNQSEWWIKQQVMKILEDTEWTYWTPNAGAYGRGGVSDFLAVKHPKLFMAIEAKYGDVPTALQRRFLTSVHDAGHFAFVVDETNINDLRKLLTDGGTYETLMKWQETLTTNT